MPSLSLSLTKGMTTVAGRRTLALEIILAPGERVAIHGPSGAGKTSLLRLIAGLDPPDTGRITWGDQVWFDAQQGINRPARQRQVGFLFQESALFPNMTVRENLAFAQPCPDPDRLAELLTWIGLEALGDRLPGQLSGGQRQRAALARALARNPLLLLLDEPFASLDASLRQRLRADLDRILTNLKITTILVSHDPGDLFRLADRVIVLDHGMVTAIGTPREIFFANSVVTGRYLLHGTVLLVEDAGVVRTVTVAIGADFLTALATPEEADGLRPGDQVGLLLNGGNAIIQRDEGNKVG